MKLSDLVPDDLSGVEFNYAVFSFNTGRGVMKYSDGKFMPMKSPPDKLEELSKVMRITGMNFTALIDSFTDEKISVVALYYSSGQRFFNEEETKKYCTGLRLDYKGTTL